MVKKAAAFGQFEEEKITTIALASAVLAAVEFLQAVFVTKISFTVFAAQLLLCEGRCHDSSSLELERWKSSVRLTPN